MKLKEKGKVRIGKDSTKGYVYPKLRLPKYFSNLVGEKVIIYEAILEEGTGILIVPEKVGQIRQNELDNLEIVGLKNDTEKEIREIKKAILEIKEIVSENRREYMAYLGEICRGGDSNPRPPDYESGAPTS